MEELKAFAEFVVLLAANNCGFIQRVSLVCGLQLASDTWTGTNRYLGGCQ